MIKFPKIMGIVNVTPDSFSDGGDYNSTNNAVNHALNLLDEGAEIIDVGGESTRPGAAEVSEQEEIDRVIPVINKILKEKPDSYISIDTSKYGVAKLALESGAKMVNDITGLQNSPEIADLVSKHTSDLCIMHIQGKPRTMQNNPSYFDVVDEVYQFLSVQTNFAESKGCKNIYVDVGIGFGKTVEHNLTLLKNLEKFNNIGSGQLLGISRKSFIAKTLNINDPKDRDIPTSFIHSLLLQKNVKIIRVHNVKMLNSLKKCFDLVSN